jgi:rod shape-determining protein MreB
MAISNHIGIDLGTANILVYVKGKGIVLNEPSIVAADTGSGDILAVGDEARTMLGRTPANIISIRPLKDGVISNYGITEKMLKYFIRKVSGASRFFRPTIMICVPSGVTEVEKRAVVEAGVQAGGKEVHLIEEPIAAAIGAGLDIAEADGKMVVDIGGGTTDIAVISLGTIVKSTSVKIAGNKLDDAIVSYMRKVHKLFIGDRMAEDMKKVIGTVYPREENIYYQSRGRDLVTGLPRSVEISSDEMLDALEIPIQAIIDKIHEILEETPPELAADIATNGLYITGGGALLSGIDARINASTKINAIIADDPLDCVAIGTGKALDSIDLISEMNIKKRNLSWD